MHHVAVHLMVPLARLATSLLHGELSPSCERGNDTIPPPACSSVYAQLSLLAPVLPTFAHRPMSSARFAVQYLTEESLHETCIL